MIRKVLIALMVTLMLSSVASARVVEKVNVPETLTEGDQMLVLNGAGVRNVFLNDVYVGGLWLENAATDGNAIAAADEPMAIRIHVLNDFFASSKHINEAFHKGFRYAMPKGDISSIKPELERLEAAFSDKITDGEEFDLVYIPGKGTSIYKGIELKDTIPGLEFKRLLFGIWLSDKATVNKGLKKGMLEGKVAPEALAAKEQLIEKIKAEKATAMAQAKEAEKAAMKAAAEAKATAAMEANAEKEAAMKVAAAEKANAEKQAEMDAARAKKAEEETVAQEEKALTEDTFDDQDVFFGVNSAALSAKAKHTLAMKAKWMKSNPIVNVTVGVYCDSRGSQQYNMALAKRRAKSVVNYIVEAGIDASRIKLVIYGAVKSAANEKAWANNRRAHFSIE